MIYYYFVYRVYSADERNYSLHNSRLYGWTHNKSILKAFLKQRNNRKYFAEKHSEDEISEMFSENKLFNENMIDYINIRSATSGEEFMLFTTLQELTECEHRIQQYFEDLSSFTTLQVKGEKIPYYVNMVLSLREDYLDALNTIGYNPKEINILYDDAEYDYRIDSAFDMDSGHIIWNPLSNPKHSTRFIYTLESFIKVLKDDM
jgi:hypothetical protein